MSRTAMLFRRGLPATAGVAAPADRRFRRPDVRPGRRRRWGAILRRALTIGVVAGTVIAAAVWATHAVLTARWLSVSSVAISGNARLSTPEVEALVDGVVGQNVLTVDLDRFRQRLMDSPWVETASLRRVLPGTVEVRLTERTPIVIARLGQELYLVDAAGVIVDEFGPQYREYDLPIADGLVRTPRRGEPLVDPARMALTERFLEELAGHRELRERVSQVDVSDPRDAVVLLAADGTLVHLGDAKFADRLTRYIELAPALQERLTQIDYVDMRFDERVYVRSKGQVAAVQK